MGLAASFLRAAYVDALMRHRRLAFSALALLENERIIQKVDRALHSTAQRTRADALEVLSNLGVIGLIPVIGTLVVIYWNVQPSEDGQNQYG